jgi:phosphoribosyl-AMP cyclohydrolase / phosphoribosyl-ATP pyrophosphohydrolase
VAWVSDRRPDWTRGPLLPVVVTDADDGSLLMLAWATADAVAATERTRQAHFWSRSRGELWRKGATSGHTMAVVDMAVDCDADAIRYRVRPAGPACHTGERSCFEGDPRFDLAALARVITARRAAAPEASYTARLLAGGPRRPAEKVTEEAGELSAAALAGTDAEVVAEAADVLYHVLVLLEARGLTLGAVEDELARRHAAP